MKKYIITLLFFLSTSFIHANDTYFYTSGGNLIPAEETDITVEMKSEVISIVLQENFYEVTVDFDFYNSGKTVDLLVGFPFFEAGISGHGKFYDFKCWTNEVLTDYSDQPLVREFSNRNFDEPVLEKAYTRKISFPEKTTTKTRVYYKSEYGLDTDGSIIKYLYGTGSSWKGNIGKMTIIIENKIQYEYLDNIKVPGNVPKFMRIADNKWEAHLYNIEPEYKDCITIHTMDILDNTGPRAFPTYGFSFRDHEATPNWLFWYTAPQLRIIRNTIYALHGYEFKSEDLRKLFSDWGSHWYPEYKINPNFTDDDLSEIEKKNIKMLICAFLVQVVLENLFILNY